jgi:SRSO17 transposase
MERTEFERLTEDFQRFGRRYGPLFGGWAAQERGEQYVRGLLVGGAERRNAENLAEQVEGATPRALQRFLSEAPWSVERVIERLQEDVAALLESPDGVWVVDETGFAKQGTKSVGVARQYSGTLGKVGNCQIGVFLGYASARGQALVDARLYLPERWTDNRARCRAAGVPDEVPFQTKPELALTLLRQARAWGHLQARWVTGDEVYGGSPAFRDALAADGYWYVLEVPGPTPVCPLRPDATPLAPLAPGSARPRADLEPPKTVAELAAGLAPERWQLLTVTEGAQGPRVYQVAKQRVREVRDGVIGAEREVLLRRNPDGSELRLYLANTPRGVALLVLARIASARWTIETGFEQAKGEAGLDEYEVRSWAGWHHHITLALLASLFLLQVRGDWGGKPTRVDDPAGQSGAARTAAATDLDRGRPGGLAAADPGAERGGKTLPRPATAA